MERCTIDLDGFAALLSALRARGYELLGPRVRDGAVVHDAIEGVDDLPRGVGDAQAPGEYRLRARSDAALFGFASAAHSWKRELLVPRTTLVRIRRGKDGPAFEAPEVPRKKRAFVGVRACDLAAIAVQDRILLGDAYADPDYAARRDGVFVVAVDCAEPSGTCFCASMDTGPRARSGFDLALTEILDGDHRFLVEVGSDAGAEVIADVPRRAVEPADDDAAHAVVARATQRMGRVMDTTGIQALLQGNQTHPRWDDVADRCLGCANCTMACPTCFCTTVEDSTDLEGDTAERTRRWDSCFTMDFSHVHGGSVRSSSLGRYRQWMTHKLASWFDQFGTSGCVGCGRCLTWCPVGIDITEEVAAIRASTQARTHQEETP